MTLGNMRELGVRSLFVTCELCHHVAVLPADRWGDVMAVGLAVGFPYAASPHVVHGRPGHDPRYRAIDRAACAVDELSEGRERATSRASFLADVMSHLLDLIHHYGLRRPYRHRCTGVGDISEKSLN